MVVLYLNTVLYFIKQKSFSLTYQLSEKSLQISIARTCRKVCKQEYMYAWKDGWINGYGNEFDTK